MTYSKFKSRGGNGRSESEMERNMPYFAFYCCDAQHKQRSMGTKGLLWLIGYHQGKPGQELKAGTRRQKLKRDHGRMLLTHGRMACSSCSAHLPFLSNPGLLAQRLHCSQWFAHCLAHLSFPLLG